MESIKVTVIIPVYNAEKYLCKCVDSVLNQNFKNISVLLVNDGSKDNSGKICDDYLKKDNRIKVFHKENGGAASARNVGLQNVDGDYFVFLDSDDYWDDIYALDKLINYAVKTSSDVICFSNKRFYQIDNKIVEFESKLPNGVCDIEKIMQVNYYISSANLKFYSSKVLKCNISFPEGKTGEDIDWSAKLLSCNYKISWLDENFYVYRKQNSLSTTSNIKRKSVEDVFDIIKKYVEQEKVNNYKNKLLLNYLANEYVLLLTFSNKVKTKEIKALLKEIKSLWWLINYSLYPYVKKVKKIKFLGFSIIRKLLGVYSCLKN